MWRFDWRYLRLSPDRAEQPDADGERSQAREHLHRAGIVRVQADPPSGVLAERNKFGKIRRTPGRLALNVGQVMQSRYSFLGNFYSSSQTFISL